MMMNIYSTVLTNSVFCFLTCSLISKMLVRDPDKRCTLDEIENHPWLNQGSTVLRNPPLISRQNISEQMHNSILEMMISGKIADRATILK